MKVSNRKKSIRRRFAWRKPLIIGPAFVFGVVPLKTIFDPPRGEMRISIRPNEFVRVTVTDENGSGQFVVVEEGSHWRLAQLVGSIDAAGVVRGDFVGNPPRASLAAIADRVTVTREGCGESPWRPYDL